MELELGLELDLELELGLEQKMMIFFSYMFIKKCRFCLGFWFLRGDIDFDPRRASGASPRDPAGPERMDRFSTISK